MPFFFAIRGRDVPIFDKSKWQTSNKYFSKGDPLQLLKLWNRALWLAKKRSHGQFQGLSLVKSTACVFLYPLRSGFSFICGICQIWDTPYIWQTLVTNPKIRDVNFYATSVYRGPYSTNPDDKLRQIWFFQICLGFFICGGICHIWVGLVISGWDLSNVGEFVIYGWGLSNMGSYILR